MNGKIRKKERQKRQQEVKVEVQLTLDEKDVKKLQSLVRKDNVSLGLWIYTHLNIDPETYIELRKKVRHHCTNYCQGDRRIFNSSSYKQQSPNPSFFKISYPFKSPASAFYTFLSLASAKINLHSIVVMENPPCQFSTKTHPFSKPTSEATGPKASLISFWPPRRHLPGCKNRAAPVQNFLAQTYRWGSHAIGKLLTLTISTANLLEFLLELIHGLVILPTADDFNC